MLSRAAFTCALASLVDDRRFNTQLYNCTRMIGSSISFLSLHLLRILQCLLRLGCHAVDGRRKCTILLQLQASHSSKPAFACAVPSHSHISDDGDQLLLVYITLVRHLSHRIFVNRPLDFCVMSRNVGATTIIANGSQSRVRVALPMPI